MPSQLNAFRFAIPPRPEVLVTINQLLKTEDPDIPAICKLIKQDAALYSAVLSTINSAAFSLVQRITSIEHAVSLLGVGRLYNIVRLSALKNSLSTRCSLERFWDSAAEIAQLCCFIARNFSALNSEDAYTLGMLHDCGIPLILAEDENFKQMLQQLNRLPIAEIEQAQLKAYGTSHFRLGAKMLHDWGFSDDLSRAVAAQPHFQDVLAQPVDERETMRFGLSCLTLARDISDSYRRYWRMTDRTTQLHELDAALKFLGLTDEEYLDMREDCADWLTATASRS
ncbi:HDOD domain-containing protein [Neptuniibacter sp. CAU 1671]|uniref:HDOD domain-containing protein n=1 Tax=Neptuniibacter sp. CAU 1671 TaxID=3032593 RepID=UPI0023D9AA2C|nr:HDOD domain-containing protein [Neptuniibacter sp. CAU 1671]MDF2183047.1 HDOD domain-containing protein [Neptuniibacter sp. CAU 1671]